MHIAHVLCRLVLPRSVGRVVGFGAPDVGIFAGLFGYIFGMEMSRVRAA